MRGYIKKRGNRYYAVIYEGRGPVTGKERRSWHPAGTDRAEAERLAAKLAATETARADAVRSLTFGSYLTSQWRPAKNLHLATSTYRGYQRNVQRHILPALGRVGIRRLHYHAPPRGARPQVVRHRLLRGPPDARQDQERPPLPTSTSCLACRPTLRDRPSGSPSPFPRPRVARGKVGVRPEEER